MTVYTYVGWLQEPDSRPPFTELVKKFEEFLDDPLRYVLTVTDGCVSDYGNLPSNILVIGECTYENPFTRDGRLDTTDGQLSPNSNVFSSSEYQNEENKPTFEAVRMKYNYRVIVIVVLLIVVLLIVVLSLCCYCCVGVICVIVELLLLL